MKTVKENQPEVFTYDVAVEFHLFNLILPLKYNWEKSVI